jgi:catechol 2,3-dioxygenase-like lactoylglutathione lyase family enzyme
MIWSIHLRRPELPMLKQISPLLQVRDIDASAEFYAEKLGFETGPTGGGFCMIRRDECWLFLAQKTKDVDVTNRAARAVDDGWCGYDLHIHCAPGTLDRLYTEFRSRGVAMHESFQDGPVLRDYGVRDFSLLDPDGYELVFGEEMPES